MCALDYIYAYMHTYINIASALDTHKKELKIGILNFGHPIEIKIKILKMTFFQS